VTALLKEVLEEGAILALANGPWAWRRWRTGRRRRRNT
jgi:hypothetical protein